MLVSVYSVAVGEIMVMTGGDVSCTSKYPPPDVSQMVEPYARVLCVQRYAEVDGVLAQCEGVVDAVLPDYIVVQVVEPDLDEAVERLVA